MALELEVALTQLSHLLDPGAGVVKKEQQGPVTQGVRPRGRELSEQALDLIALQKEGGWWRDALDGDGHHPLGLGEPLRQLGGQVLEEGLERGQTLVARAHVIVSLALQGLQETPYPFGGELCELHTSQPAAELASDEEQKQPQGVPIALQRGGAQPLLGLQVILEEGKYQ